VRKVQIKAVATNNNENGLFRDQGYEQILAQKQVMRANKKNGNGKRSIFFTGATGFIGGHIAERLMSEGYAGEAFLLARGEKEKINKTLREKFFLISFGLDDNYQYQVAHGDVTEESVTNEILPSKLDAIWHCAGLLSFKQEDADLDYQVNVVGTQNMLALAERCDIEEFHFVSTAYICGTREGVIMENEFDEGQKFNNPYEATKFEAEKIVSDWGEKHGIPTFIYRPGIVIGDYYTGRAFNFSGYYTMVRSFLILKKMIIRKLQNNGKDLIAQGIRLNGTHLILPVRLPCQLETPINLVTVNFLTEMIVGIAKKGIPGIYHIVNPNPPSFWELATISFDIMGIKGVRLVGDVPADLTEVENMLYQNIFLYFSYLKNNQFFDYTNTKKALGHIPEMPITRSLLERIIGYAIQSDFGRTQAY